MNVVKFTSTSKDSKEFIEMFCDYSKQVLSENHGYKFSFEKNTPKEMKAQSINNAWVNLLQRRSGYKLSDFDSVAEFGSLTAVNEFAQGLNKLMLNAIYPYVFDAPLFNTLCEMHFVGYGDSLQINMKDNSLFNVSKFGRRQKHLNTQEREAGSKTITTDQYGITTITSVPDILTGKAMIADDVLVSALSMQAKIYELVLNEFKTKADAITIPSLVASGAFVEKTWQQKLKAVKAYSAMGVNPILFGDTIALKHLLPTAQNTRIDLQDPYNTTIGYMDRWNGHSVFGFDAVGNNDGDYGVLGLDEDTLYGIAPSASKFIHVAVGNTMTNSDDNYDNINLSKLTTLRQELGVELVTNEVMAVYKDIV